MNRVVTLKFDGQLIRTDLPLPNLFTGNITLSFNWKEGKLLHAQASKTASVSIEENLSTLQRMDRSDILNSDVEE